MIYLFYHKFFCLSPYNNRPTIIYFFAQDKINFILSFHADEPAPKTTTQSSSSQDLLPQKRPHQQTPAPAVYLTHYCAVYNVSFVVYSKIKKPSRRRAPLALLGQHQRITAIRTVSSLDAYHLFHSTQPCPPQHIKPPPHLTQLSKLIHKRPQNGNQSHSQQHPSRPFPKPKALHQDQPGKVLPQPLK
jgi:hypothetical protein